MLVDFTGWMLLWETFSVVPFVVDGCFPEEERDGA